MMKRNPAALLQWIGLILSIQEARGRKSDAHRRFHLSAVLFRFKFQEIIFKGKPVLQRRLKARMTADSEVHLFCSAVFHLIGDPEGILLQLINNPQRKHKRITGERPLIRIQTQHKADNPAVLLTFLFLYLGRQLRGGQKAVDGHPIRLSMNRTGFLRQPRNIGKQVRRLTVPVGGIALP